MESSTKYYNGMQARLEVTFKEQISNKLCPSPVALYSLGGGSYCSRAPDSPRAHWSEGRIV